MMMMIFIRILVSSKLIIHSRAKNAAKITGTHPARKDVLDMLSDPFVSSFDSVGTKESEAERATNALIN